MRVMMMSNFPLCQTIDYFFWKHLPKPCWRIGMEKISQYKIQYQNTLIQWIYIYTELLWLFCCQRQQADEQKDGLLVGWAAIALMKHQCIARGAKWEIQPDNRFLSSHILLYRAGRLAIATYTKYYDIIGWRWLPVGTHAFRLLITNIYLRRCFSYRKHA